MSRLDAEEIARIKAAVEDGKIRVGSSAHLRVIQFDIDQRGLAPRDRRIIQLAVNGHSHVTIAEAVNLSRSRVTNIIGEFFKGKRK